MRATLRPCCFTLVASLFWFGALQTVNARQPSSFIVNTKVWVN